jgi:CheY-like chemotaxis protein
MADPTFLYVEDDPLSRQVMTVLLKRVIGFSEFTIFENSENFTERIKALPKIPDVIFLDVQVRPHDGYELLKMLRQDPAYQNAKIIAMTANVMVHDVEELRRTGFSGLIGKPIMKENFPELLKRILEGQSVWFIP